MKVKKIITRGVLFSCLAFLFCSNEDDNLLNSTADFNEMYGVWYTVIPPNPAIADTVDVEYEINSDSSFYFSVSNRNNGDTLIVNWGNWTTVADSVSLNGRECSVLDTVAKEMVPFLEFKDGYDAIPPVVMPVDIESGVWRLKGTDLRPLVDVLVPPQVLTMFGVIEFEREEE